MDGSAGELLAVLDSLDEQVKFCSAESLGVVLPGLEVQGSGSVPLPVTPAIAKKLIRQASQAPYGRGEETVVDTSVRQVWQLEPSQFEITNPQWDEFITDITGAVCEDFAINARVEASLYKLLIYEKGSFFAPHRDSEKVDGMFATLVVCLPSKHTGGRLLVTHDGRTEQIDFGGDESPFQTSYAAFYADCQHEITPITSGYRVCLVYNLSIPRRKKQPAAPRNSQAVDQAEQLLAAIFADESRSRIAIPFVHHYTESGFGPQELKGSDRTRADVLAGAAERLNLDISLALFTHYQSGTVDYNTLDYDPWSSRRSRYRSWYDDDDDELDDSGAEFEDIFDEELTLNQWYSIDGRKRPFGTMRLAESELLLSPGSELPHTQQIHEATGNEGVTMDRWYRQGVVVIWPQSQYFRILAREGPQSAVPALEEKLRSTKRTAIADGRTFASEIIREWADESAQWRRGTWRYHLNPEHSDGESLTGRMLRQLRKIADHDLTREFLARVLPEHLDGTEGPELASLLNHLGWNGFQSEVQALFEKQSPATYRLKMNDPVRLFHDLCCSRGGMSAERRNVCAACVPGIEKWISAWDAKPQSRWDDLDDDWDDPDDDWDVSGVLTRNADRPPVRAVVTELFLLGLNAIEDAHGLERLVDYVLNHERRYPTQTVLVPAIRSVQKKLKEDAPACGAVQRLIEASLTRLRKATATQPQPPTDWARECRLKCSCADCRELKSFLKNPNTETLRIAIRKDRRQHLHQQITRHQLDTTHVTERRGSPQTLVCTKNQASYERRLAQYHEDSRLLEELVSCHAVIRG